LVEKGSLVKKPDFNIKFSSPQMSSIKFLLKRFEQNPFSPPSIKDCITDIGDDVFNAMVELGELKQVSADVVFLPKDYDLLVKKLSEYIELNGQITVAEARDLFNTSRRFVLALLEYLDSIGFTSRVGDVRRLRR
jgi:selenocysteine-specific elongation factor